ncbi:hypothetical protein KM043_002564 [Ampulex compressa]|nr:hypothetical protein KM043_002564 [Ampulex compressa]
MERHVGYFVAVCFSSLNNPRKVHPRYPDYPNLPEKKVNTEEPTQTDEEGRHCPTWSFIDPQDVDYDIRRASPSYRGQDFDTQPLSRTIERYERQA